MCAEQILNPDKATTFPARNIVGSRIDAPKVVTEVFARLGSHKEAITRHINRQISGKLTRGDKDASRKSAPRTPAYGTVTEATAAAGQAQDEGSSVMTFICRALETYLLPTSLKSSKSNSRTSRPKTSKGRSRSHPLLSMTAIRRSRSVCGFIRSRTASMTCSGSLDLKHPAGTRHPKA